MIYDTIIVGGGASGLTAAAFLAKGGHKTLLLEKQPQCGGLVNSFTRDGITFDGGIRSLENAGVLLPMLKALGIEIELRKSSVTLGIEDRIIKIHSHTDLAEYQDLLQALYPDSRDEIAEIIKDLLLITQYMDIQYGIDNPLFLDIKEDRDYFMREVFPWMFKYALTVGKVNKKDQPVIPYLQKFTSNTALIDIIAQHFFTATPAYFALSYFRLYTDYYYPKGGTGAFSQKLVDFIQSHGGEIWTESPVTGIDIEKHTVSTPHHREIGYRQLLWAADQKALYENVEPQSISNPKVRTAIDQQKSLLSEMKGNDSVLSLFASTNLSKAYFEKISTGHFFYTPSREGISKAGTLPAEPTWEQIAAWLARFFALTTYEISIPVLRDEALAPPGKTGLILSILFDYHLTRDIDEKGWTALFKELTADLMIATLEKSIYPGLAAAIEDRLVATPLTIQQRNGSTDGAITGWSFTNHPIPAENRLVKIANSVKTPLPDVFQAGQWTYSPSGLPVALITGKVAADAIHKKLK